MVVLLALRLARRRAVWRGSVPQKTGRWPRSIGVPESPVWLRNREARLAQRHEPRAPAKLRPRFKLTGAAFQAIAFMGFLEFQKAAIYTYYPTILRGSHHLSQQAVFWPVTLYCAGSFGGKVLCGWLAERFGEVRVMLSALIVVMLTIDREPERAKKQVERARLPGSPQIGKTTGHNDPLILCQPHGVLQPLRKTVIKQSTQKN